MNVLVINCGSSSLKYQLIDKDTEQVLAKGLCERIGIEGSCLTHKVPGKEDYVDQSFMEDHKVAVQKVLDALVDADHGVIASVNEINAVGHRVLHGSVFFTDSVVINDEVKKVIRDCFDLGPLHNPANLIGIEACEALMGDTPQVAVFDTAFHQTMPEKAYMYAIPREYYDKYHIRKYGFHGTSHSFVSKRTIEVAGLDKDNSKVIVCHLGNGSSISAVQNGKCVDTSMGLTPLEGLIMGTRSGDVDAAVVQYIANKENKTVDEVLNILNKKSGVLALSQLSSDFRDLDNAADEGNELARLALDAFIYRVVKYVGSYVAAMNGVDCITFTAGIGENNSRMRKAIMSSFEYLGIKIDDEANAKRGEELIISTADSKVKVCVIPTNEELAICRETVALVNA
ncbi:MAG: acetate kinase [Lachnospiraceae bacterium]|nr:acetate kinase [Lachnospiraceae bacterium]